MLRIASEKGNKDIVQLLVTIAQCDINLADNVRELYDNCKIAEG